MKQTIKNLMSGFIKESQIRIRYEFYSEIAKKEKFIFISKSFTDFAIQVFSSANWFYETLQQLKKEEYFETINVELENATTFGTTIINLESLIQEEEDNWQKLYPNYANTAEMEGYKKIAKKLKNLANIKKNRSQRLKMFLNLINTDDFSEKVAITLWTCMACGYEIAINELPKDYICPTCGHNISYFQKKTLQLIHDEVSYQRTKRSGWVCMECGYEVALEQLPDDWKCVSCGRSKEYFKRITLKPIDIAIKTSKLEKAHWVCLECGNEEDIEMPVGWKCPKCGSPK